MQLVTESLDDAITTSEAAAMCGVALSTISKWRERGHLQPIDGDKPPVYRRIDVLRCARDTRQRALGKTRIA